MSGKDFVCCSIYCSKQYYKSINKNYLLCDNCGKRFYVKPENQKKYSLHYCSLSCLGEARKTLYIGDKNPNYNNRDDKNPMTKETRITVHGYKLVKAIGHPFAINGFWIKEHRLIAEKYLMNEEQSVEVNGINYLNPKLSVHHINGDRLDNKPENLLILTRSEHMKLHWELKKKLASLNSVNCWETLRVLNTKE